ncbi:unnamed protein product, partial [Polarella glacialis]
MYHLHQWKYLSLCLLAVIYMPTTRCDADIECSALMLVAHPDDETLFGSEILLGQQAHLPNGCRRPRWLVISVT